MNVSPEEGKKSSWNGSKRSKYGKYRPKRTSSGAGTPKAETGSEKKRATKGASSSGRSEFVSTKSVRSPSFSEQIPPDMEKSAEQAEKEQAEKRMRIERQKSFFVQSLAETIDNVVEMKSNYILADSISRMSLRISGAFRDSLSRLNAQSLNEVSERIRFSYTKEDALFALVLAIDVYNKRIAPIPEWECLRKRMLSDEGTIADAKELTGCFRQ